MTQAEKQAVALRSYETQRRTLANAIRGLSKARQDALWRTFVRDGLMPALVAISKAEHDRRSLDRQARGIDEVVRRVARTEVSHA